MIDVFALICLVIERFTSGAANASIVSQYEDRSVVRALLTYGCVIQDIRCIQWAQCSIMLTRYGESFAIVFLLGHVPHDPVVCIEICDVNEASSVSKGASSVSKGYTRWQ